MSELLGANTDVLERHAESLSADARRVQDIRGLAQRAVSELQAGWNGSDLIHLSQQWEQQASPMLSGASACLDTCASQLRAQSGAQHLASQASGGGSPTRHLLITAPAPPPTSGRPADNAAWWTSLSTLQQQRVIREHPEWVGNRDGVSFTDRDVANHALLATGRDRLVAERKRLETTLADNWFGGVFTNDDEALRRVKDKLKSLDVIDATLVSPGERQLLLLDLEHERVQAAIANGNVDTADNVADFVPGMNSSVSETMSSNDTAMRHLQQNAQFESIRAHPTQTTTAATVTWVGYQTPEWGLDLLPKNARIVLTRVMSSGSFAVMAPATRSLWPPRNLVAE